MHHPQGELPPKLVEHSRSLRRNLTLAERKLWRLLRDRRLIKAKFRRQHVTGNYILDFFCSEADLAVEVDGGQHAQPEQAEYDRRRDEFLRGQGITVLRFWCNDVLANIDAVLAEIAKYLE
ncbi:MAG TPA: endonuclease domain-containing protein [bacterium]|nr:endonuclease domain-containing protein [bacterium]